MEEKMDKNELRLREKLLADNNKHLRFQAAEQLACSGDLEAIKILVRALMDGRKNTYETATWGLVFVNNQKQEYGEFKLQEIFKPAIRYLTNIVETAEVLRGHTVKSYKQNVVIAVNTLRAIGDVSAISALEKLLVKVQKKIEKYGDAMEWVETESYAGYDTTYNAVQNIEWTIKSIKEREKL